MFLYFFPGNIVYLPDLAVGHKTEINPNLACSIVIE